jgi:hypothetical protein
MSLVRAKLVATGIHFALSTVLIGAVTLLLFQLWYPWPLWKILDAPGMLLIAIGVDLVIGPLLTAVVYKPGKRTLKMDLTVIVMLQLAALGFGVHTMAQARPVYVLASFDRFEIVSAYQLVEKELADGDAQWRNLSWTGPKYAGIRLPTALEQVDAFFEAVAGNDLHFRPRFYKDFEPAWRILSVRCTKISEGRCELIAHYRGVFWKVVADDQGRLIDVIGKDVDNLVTWRPNAPQPSEPRQTLPFLQQQPFIPIQPAAPPPAAPEDPPSD